MRISKLSCPDIGYPVIVDQSSHVGIMFRIACRNMLTLLGGRCVLHSDYNAGVQMCLSHRRG